MLLTTQHKLGIRLLNNSIVYKQMAFWKIMCYDRSTNVAASRKFIHESTSITVLNAIRYRKYKDMQLLTTHLRLTSIRVVRDQ
jgi:hypothetical protein